MKKLILVITTLIVGIALLGADAHAHIVKINQDLLDLDVPIENSLFTAVPRVLVNRIDTLSSPGFHESEFFTIPDSTSPVKFLVGEQVNVVINKKFLGYPEEIYDNLTIVWDFGDGTKILSGPSVSHTYDSPGSYIIKIGLIQQIENAAGIESAEQFAKQVSYSNVLVNVATNKTYDLPEATIFAFSNPAIFGKDRIQFVFDLAHSRGSSELSYLFDYGDGKTTNSPVTVHSYTRSDTHKRAVARVWDSSGFFSDEHMDVYPELTNSFAVFTKYKDFIYRTLEDSINNVSEQFRTKQINKINLLGYTFGFGFLQFLVTPLTSILLVLYGRKRYAMKIRHTLQFSYSYLITQMFFSLVLSLLTLYYTNGYVLTDVISNFQFVIGGALLVLIFSRALIVRRALKITDSEISTLGAALGIIVNPFSFVVTVMNTYFLDSYDAVYLLFVFTVGILVANLFLIKIGLAIQKIIFNRT